MFPCTGPKTDEFFTVSIGGMVTVLNTSGTPIHPGDLGMRPGRQWMTHDSAGHSHALTLCLLCVCVCVSCAVEWTFYSESGTHAGKRQKQGPRRVGITVASVSSPKIIGRALSFAKAGESMDILLK